MKKYVYSGKLKDRPHRAKSVLLEIQRYTPHLEERYDPSTLRKNCKNTDFFLVRIFSVSVLEFFSANC